MVAFWICVFLLEEQFLGAAGRGFLIDDGFE